VLLRHLFDHKLKTAERFGMTHGFNSKDNPNFKEKILEIVGDQGADVVIDTTGNVKVIELAYDLTRPDGKTILVGVPRKGEKVSIYTLPIHFDKVLTGSHGGNARPHIDIPRYIRLCQNGKMALDGLITHEFKLDDINKALDTIRRGKTGRVLIAMD